MRKHLSPKSTQTAIVLLATPAILLISSGAGASTYHVGPGKSFANLQDIAPLLTPGDVVELAGDATYPGGVVFEKSGTNGAKITIRGIRKDGKRPRIAGG